MLTAVKSKALAALALAAVVGAGLISATSPAAIAEGATLEGHWSGGGQIIFPSGESERARCRAQFRRRGGGFDMNAVCATPSTRVEQTADLSPAGGNRYHGEFQNREYGISGQIRITVSGNHLDASLSGGGGHAKISMSR